MLFQGYPAKGKRGLWGEMSAHHYFRDFASCDSGMIPWLLIAEMISKTGHSLAELVDERMARFPASGEINRKVDDANETIARIRAAFEADATISTPRMALACRSQLGDLICGCPIQSP